jgi:predicted PurR-regulated permease PerM
MSGGALADVHDDTPHDNPGDEPLPEESEIERRSLVEATEEAAQAAERWIERPHTVLSGQIRTQEMFALVGGFGLLALLLAEIILFAAGGEYAIVHPIFPLAALVFFLYPFRNETVARRTMQLGVAAFIVWLIVTLSGVLFPFIVSFVVAYLCYPLVAWLDRHGVSRIVTALTIVLAILGIYAVVGIVLIPLLVEQFDQLITSAQSWLKGANTIFDQERLARELSRFGLPRAQARRIVAEQVQPQLQAIVSIVFAWFGDFLRNITQVVEGVFVLLLIPFLTLYMMIDFRRIRVFVRTTLLQDNPRWVFYITRVDTIVSAYMRGILITSSMVGAMAIAVLSLFGVPYAVVIGIMTGLLNLIPTIGMFMNLGIAMIIYLFAPGDFWYNTLITAVLIGGLHALNSNLVEPRILGDRVGLHPVMVIGSLFVFGHFLGFVGLLIAVPTTAVILMFLKEWYRKAVTLEKPVYVNPVNPAS